MPRGCVQCLGAYVVLFIRSVTSWALEKELRLRPDPDRRLFTSASWRASASRWRPLETPSVIIVGTIVPCVGFSYIDCIVRILLGRVQASLGMPRGRVRWLRTVNQVNVGSQRLQTGSQEVITDGTAYCGCLNAERGFSVFQVQYIIGMSLMSLLFLGMFLSFASGAVPAQRKMARHAF